MRRVATQDMELSNGIRIPKGGTLAVSTHNMWDANLHKNPDSWDGYRFLRMRETQQTAAQLVTTTPEHLGFGHGKHACPGRFFAANEVKIALIYLLLRYDWRLPEGAEPKPRRHGFSLGTDPFLKMEVKRRQAEMDI